jgi:hypothetical protein
MTMTMAGNGNSIYFLNGIIACFLLYTLFTFRIRESNKVSKNNQLFHNFTSVWSESVCVTQRYRQQGYSFGGVSEVRSVFLIRLRIWRSIIDSKIKSHKKYHFMFIQFRVI